MSTQIRKGALAALIILTAAVGAVWAGQSATVVCSDAKCGAHTRVSTGGGWFFSQVSGYCTQCEKFVELKWKGPFRPRTKGENDVPEPKQVVPEPIGRIWNPATGKKMTVWACPHCKGPFAELQSLKEITHCPKCGAPESKIEDLVNYD